MQGHNPFVSALIKRDAETMRETRMTRLFDIIIREVYRCIVLWNQGPCLPLKIDAKRVILHQVLFARRVAIKNAFHARFNDDLPFDWMHTVISGVELYYCQHVIEDAVEKWLA